MAEKSAQKILPLTYDVMFKIFFTRHIEELKKFIVAMTHLTMADLIELTMLNPALEKRMIKDKAFVVDILVKTISGKLIHIEMQMSNHLGFTERIVCYNAKN